MASLVPEKEKELTTVAWAAQTLKVALLRSTFFGQYNYLTHYTYTSVTAYELPSGDYTTGGKSIVCTSSVVDSTTAKLDAPDLSWGPGYTMSDIRYAVLYDTVANRIRAIYELSATESCTNSTFTLVWHSNGMIRIA